MKKNSTVYEVREVDAWADGDQGWTYNASYNIGSFASASDNISRAARKFLANNGIRFVKGKTKTYYDGSIYEIISRKDYQPLYAIIPQEV